MKISTYKLAKNINKYFDEHIEFYKKHAGNSDEIEKVINSLRETELRCVHNIESLNKFYLTYKVD